MSKSVSRKSTPAKRSTRLSPEAAKLLPYDDFPLSPHLPTRRWYKVIRGFRHYFGPLDDPDAALAKYLRERDYLYTGRTPPPDPEDLYTIRDLCNEFLTAQDRRVNTGDLTARTRVELHRACTNITKALGKDRAVEDLRPEDFEKLRALLAKTKNDQQRSPTVLAKSIRHVKQVFKWAFDNDRIEKPVKYGTYFDPPSEALLREQKNKRDDLIFTATEIKALLSKASVPMKAMILLGINCGYGNTDIAELPHRAVDLDAGIVVFPRPKTKVKRWCPLWPETVAALQQALEKRPKPTKPDGHRFFITQRRQPWVQYRTKHADDNRLIGVTIDNVAQAFHKLRKRANIEGERRGFYQLRHTFETVAGETTDQKAVDFLMGHAPATGDMSARYRHWTGSERERARLQRVADHVHNWLYGTGE